MLGALGSPKVKKVQPDPRHQDEGMAPLVKTGWIMIDSWDGLL